MAPRQLGSVVWFAALAALRSAGAVRRHTGLANVTGPGKKSSKGANAELRRQQEEELEQMRALMRTFESLQSLPDFGSDDEEHTSELAWLGLAARELAAKNPEFKKQWSDLWRQRPQKEPVEPLACGETHKYYAAKRLARLYSRGQAELERRAASLCRFGKSATVFIWHMRDGNVGHVGMLLGPPDARFEEHRLKRYDAADVGRHNEYTLGLGPHKAFSGCRNHPASWRSGNCFTYVSWWPAAPGVMSNPLTPVEASMHDFDSDQASESPMDPEVIPIDNLSGAELASALKYFRELRGDPEKTYNLITENCAIGVAKVLAFGACTGNPCMHDKLKMTKDATGDLALTLLEESGCEQAECKICYGADPTCGAAAAFGDW